MTGFFFDIRGFFDQRYSGRYLSLLLRELGRREPRTFADMFKLPKKLKRSLCAGELEVDREVRFKSGQRTRIADLALLKARQPIVFFEIKEDDIGAEGNPKQLKDYLSIINAGNAKAQKHFVHVSRYLPSASEQKILEDAKTESFLVQDFRYRDLHKFLSGHLSGSVGAITHEYLEDIGVASYQGIDLRAGKRGKQVAFMLAQMLGFPHQHNLGKLHSDSAIDAVPELLKTVNANVEFLGEWVRAANPALFRQRFTRKFRPVPYFNLASLNRALKRLPDLEKSVENELPGHAGQHVQSGYGSFWAQGKISLGHRAAKEGAKFLYVEVGQTLLLSRENPPLVEIETYASFWWNGAGNEPQTASKWHSNFPSEIKAMTPLGDCLKEALKESMKTAPTAQRRALKQFRVPNLKEKLAIV